MEDEGIDNQDMLGDVEGARRRADEKSSQVGHGDEAKDVGDYKSL